MRNYKFYIFLSYLFLPIWLFAQVVFTEVMFNVQGSDYHDEYVELFNLSETELVALGGWSFSDSGGTDFLADAGFGLLLQPQQYAVILDGSYFDNSSRYDDVIPENALIIKIDNGTFGSSGLSNSIPETLYLINSTGDTVQIYRYTLNNDDGYSDEKIIFGYGNNENNWANCLVSGGTPGFRNSVTPYDYDLSVSKDGIDYHPSIMIKSDNTVQFNVSVNNSGLQTFEDSLQIKMFVDVERDSVYQSNDFTIVSEIVELQLEPAEIFTFSCSWAPVKAGNYFIVLSIASAADKNKVNNLTSLSLIVYESEETVAINEIKFLTAVDEPEWIELYNYGTKILNLFGWSFADAVDTCRIDSTVFLLPNQFKVFVSDPGLTNYYSVDDSLLLIMDGFPNLNNSSDVVCLLNPGDGWVEQVPYQFDWLEGEDWRSPSLERINPYLDCRQAVNWGPCTNANSATPANQNALYASIESQSKLKVSCQPDPFSPDGDGFEDHTIIQLHSPTRSGRLSIKIFDINGHKVRTIQDNVFTGATYSVPWDGKNDSGASLRMGIYIVLVQILDDRNGIIEEYKCTVVLAAKM